MTTTDRHRRDGKMGRAIAELAPSRGWEVVARLDEPETKQGITKQMLAGADVAVEFTTPEAAPANIRAIAAAGCPVVVGTTGWYDELPSVAAEVEQARRRAAPGHELLARREHLRADRGARGEAARRTRPGSTRTSSRRTTQRRRTRRRARP